VDPSGFCNPRNHKRNRGYAELPHQYCKNKTKASLPVGGNRRYSRAAPVHVPSDELRDVNLCSNHQCFLRKADRTFRRGNVGADQQLPG
jgi:hypothetical protein